MPTNRFATVDTYEAHKQKGSEHYFIRFPADSRGKWFVMREARRWAANPGLSFTTHNADELVAEIEEVME